MAERDEGVGDEARLRRVRIVVGMAVGDAAEIFERLEVVLLDAVAFGVHAAELPLRQRVAVFGGVFERLHGLVVVAGLEPMRAGAERFHRRHSGGAAAQPRRSILVPSNAIAGAAIKPAPITTTRNEMTQISA